MCRITNIQSTQYNNVKCKDGPCQILCLLNESFINNIVINSVSTLKFHLYVDQLQRE